MGGAVMLLETTGELGSAGLAVRDGSTLVVGTRAAQCPRCREAHFLLVNRHGETWCVECDELRVPVRDRLAVS